MGVDIWLLVLGLVAMVSGLGEDIWLAVFGWEENNARWPFCCYHRIWKLPRLALVLDSRGRPHHGSYEPATLFGPKASGHGPCFHRL